MSTVVFEAIGTRVPCQPHLLQPPRKLVTAVDSFLQPDENDDDFVIDFDSESVLGLGDEFVITGGKHSRFWLEDGNVVLVAKPPSQTQFRVHQSVLGEYSSPVCRM